MSERNPRKYFKKMSLEEYRKLIKDERTAHSRMSEIRRKHLERRQMFQEGAEWRRERDNYRFLEDNYKPIIQDSVVIITELNSLEFKDFPEFYHAALTHLNAVVADKRREPEIRASAMLALGHTSYFNLQARAMFKVMCAIDYARETSKGLE